MNDLSQLSIYEFLDHLAAKEPTPGGGSVAALGVALAAAQARMVVAYSETPKTAPQDGDRLRAAARALADADVLSRSLISKDAQAYENLSAALRSSPTADGPSAKRDRAVLEAVAVPMEVLELSRDILDQLVHVQPLLSRRFDGDVGVVAAFCSASARAALGLIRGNASMLRDPTQRAKINSDAESAAARCRQSAEIIERAINE